MTYRLGLVLDFFGLQQSFTDATFQFKKLLNVAKIGMVLFVVAFLFGYDYMTKVDPWIFNLVEDMQ